MITKPLKQNIPKSIGEKRVTFHCLSWHSYLQKLNLLPQNRAARLTYDYQECITSPTFSWVKKEDLYRFLAEAQQDKIDAEQNFWAYVRQRGTLS